MGTSVSSAVFPNVDAPPFIPNRQSQKNVTCAPTVLLQQHGKMTERNAGFLWEARAGNMKKVQEYLRQGADINATNANGLNALHLASKERHVELVRLLLKHGASVDAATRKGNTALHIACLAGQYEIVRILIEHGAAVNVQSLIGFTPLYMAAQENHRDIVNHLLEKDANPSLSTEEGCTPLSVASQQGHDEIVSILLENGKVRLPALHIAAKKEDVKAPVLPINADVISENNRRPDERTEAVTLPPTNVDEIKDALGKIMLAFNACPVCKQNKSEGTHTHRRSVEITRVDGDFGFSDSRVSDKWFFISKLKPGRDLENKLAVGDRILSVNNKDITNWDVQCFRDEITRTPTTLSLVVEYEERLVEKLQGIWGLERLKECAQKLKQLPRYNSRKAERKPEGHALQGVAGQGAQTLFESLSHANDASQSANLPLASAVSCPPNVVSPAAIPTASVSLASVQTAISTDPLISSAVAQSALLTKREQEISGSQCVPERIVPPTSSSVSSATPPSAAAASSVPNRPCLENTAYSQIAVPKASVLQNAPIEIRIPLVIRLSVQSEVEAGRESRIGVTVVSEPTSGSVATECETSAPPKASDPVGKSVETTDIPNTDTDKLAETSRKSVIVSAEYNSAAPPDASEPVEKQVSTTGTPNTENPAETERCSVIDSYSKDQIACSSDCESDDDKEKFDALGPPKTSKAVKTLGVGFTNVEKKTRSNAAPVDTAEFLKQMLGPGWKEEWNKLCSNARERGAFKAPDLAAQLQSAMEQLCTPKRENCSPPRRHHIGDKMYKQFGVIYSSQGVVDAVAYLPYRDAEVDFRRLKTQTGLHDLIAADTLPQLDFETVLVSLTDSINISEFDNLPKSVQRYVTASRIKRHGGGEAWRAPIFECQATLCSRKSKSWNVKYYSGKNSFWSDGR
ncbi:uncharacterized protein LOC129593857 isoform X2 [Paramacrobiotus metropolitanus]|uniref:uncharacterized protein LOC129593857 isoform X2 n=1 Tax=Paramacrobiotus metropolitanus TaxID=2943436 RepID=UPI0024457387|nr:uncharacterized protein LOC129593857 isoform X2 [Paramacrobiotus metropolitanus]